MGRHNQVEHCIMPDNPPLWRNYEAVRDCREYYHRHEVFPGYNRQHSKEDGLVVYLLPQQHNMGGMNEGVHKNAEYSRILKEAGQRAYEQTHSRSEFVARYGRNYL